MNASILLARLNGVRASGSGWRADCPNGHTKAHGTLSITEADDGRILLTCFACHDTPGILTSLGLEMADLFPERIRDASEDAHKSARESFRRNAGRAVLSVLRRESTIVLIAGADLQKGKALSEEDRQRLDEAVERIQSAQAVLA